jgi:hypothetical protein
MLLLNNKEEFRNVLNSTKNIKAEILNCTNSKLNLENIAQQTIKNIQGDKLILPKRKFLATRNLTIDDINEKEMSEAKNLFDLQKNFEKIKQEAEDAMLNNIEKTKKVNKII